MADSIPMKEKPATGRSSGFKLPLPSPIIPQGDDNDVQQEESAPKPMSSGAFTTASSAVEEGDSGMFTFSRPGTRAGSEYQSSFFANGRMNSGIGISYDSPSMAGQGRMHTGRPLTAVAIPEESPYEGEEPEMMSPAASLALAYREGRRPPPTRGNLSTPVIELEERMRTASRVEDDTSEGTSTPGGTSGKTEFDAFVKKNPETINIYENMDPEELLKLGDQIDYLAGLGDTVPLEEEEDSPYPEVRASVSNYDDPDMPCLTFRALSLGISLTMIGAASNTYFQIRYPSPFITPIVIQVIAYPLGAMLARFLPARTFRSSGWTTWFGMDREWSFNPGPFNIKEHTVIVIMANVGIAPAFGVHVLLAMDKFYDIKTGYGFDLLLLLSTQMIGFVFAGLCRRFLIWPAALIWPQSLVTSTLLNTFHAEDDDGSDGSLPRHRYFLYIFGGAFVWYFFPGFLFTALSAFSWICWILPSNPVVNQLFGVSTGLGMSSLTFDWSQIAYIGSPLVVPWWAIVNVMVGFFGFYWLFSPIMYYTNTWSSAYLPISVNAIFDRFGAEYNTSAILTPTLELDVAAYHRYSPVYLPIAYATVYCLAFALATSSLVHTVIYYGPTMLEAIKDIKKAQTDIHAKLMLAYKEVPVWWYLIIFAACVGMSIGVVEGFETGLPIWGLALAVLIVGLYILPGGFIFAISAQLITVNILAESIPGIALAGKPIANIIFKCYSIQALNSSLYFVQDLKLGHYMKVPHRVTFSVQILASVLAAFVQAGMKEGLLRAVPDLCSATQKARLICPTAQSIFNSSIIWGLVGPRRIFGSGSPYSAILWSLLGGALAPLPAWFLAKRYQTSWIQHVNFPVMLTGASFIPPANGINYASWFMAAFVFQYLMRRYRFRWWSKYNFVTSAAMDSGTAISAIIIFLFLQLPRSGTLRPAWWGNTVYTATYDWVGYPYGSPPEEGFGRTTWT